MKRIFSTLILLCALISTECKAQVDESELGAWYMYFFSGSIGDGPWGFQGDVQFRNWNIIGDMEQLLLRGGLTYTPEKANIKFTLGYGNITTGEFGDGKSTVQESRVYQEAMFPVKFGKRFYTNHRFRYEQRFVEGQNFRTRYRYNLFLNVALNKAAMEKGTLYLAFYNELFINGQREIGEGRMVEIFDRNRLYSALGYVINSKIKTQFGVMKQTTNSWSKSQLQLSFHQKF